MILATITGNGQTFNVCDKASKRAGNNGYNDGSKFYYPAILNQPTFSLGGNSIIEPKNITLKLDRDIVSALGSAEITITIYLWNESDNSAKFLFMNGTGQRATYNSLEYVYDIEPSKFGLDADMLSVAPDMKQVSLLLDGAHTVGDTTIEVLSNTVTNAQAFLSASGTLWISGDTYTYNSVSGDTITLSTGLTRNYADKCLILDNVTSSDERVYPMYFGFLKYAIPLQLAVSCLSGCGGSFYIDGEVKDAYDESADINYTQVEGNLTKDGSAVKFKLTADVDATSSTDGTASGVTEYVGANKVIRLATAPSAIDYDLISGDIWVDTSVSGANIRKEWNGSAWVASFDDRSDKGLDASGVSVGGVSTPNTTIPTTSTGGIVTQGSKQILIDLSTTTPAECITFNAPIKSGSVTTQSVRASDLDTIDGRVYFYNWESGSWRKRASIGLDSDWDNNAIINAGNSSTSFAPTGIAGQSGSGYGLFGASYSSYGVYALSTTNDALVGQSSNGTRGVYGVSSGTNGKGVEGYALGYIGVHGRTYSGQGLSAEVQATGNPHITSETAHIKFNKTNHAGAPTHTVTDPSMYVNSTGQLYYNKGGGSTWTAIVL